MEENYRTLEDFVLEYFALTDGLAGQVEPQVYDVIVEESLRYKLGLAGDGEISRFCFDSEAVPEHPHSRLITFGDPTLAAICEEAQARGSVAKVYLNEQNLAPHNLERKLQASINSQGVTLVYGESRVRYFTTALFFFQASFISDEKLQYPYTVGVEMHYGRPARRVEELVRESNGVAERSLPYPDAAAITRIEGYRIALSECLTQVQVTANLQKKELDTLCEKEITRIHAYFRDMRSESQENRQKLARRGGDVEKIDSQLATLNLEERQRVVDLRKKMTLKVQLTLNNLLFMSQPKLLIPLTAKSKRGTTIFLHLVWDPRTAKTEPLSCPCCQAPTLTLAVSPKGAIGCDACGGVSPLEVSIDKLKTMRPRVNR